METLTHYAGFGLALIFNALICNLLGWLCTEYKRPLFRFKPFNCRACLTFWITLLGGLELSRICALRGLWWFVGASVIIAFINFLYVKSLNTIVP